MTATPRCLWQLWLDLDGPARAGRTWRSTTPCSSGRLPVKRWLRLYRWAPALPLVRPARAGAAPLRPRADREPRTRCGAPADRRPRRVARGRADLRRGRAERRRSARCARPTTRSTVYCCDALRSARCRRRAGPGRAHAAGRMPAPASPSPAGGEIMVGGRKVVGSAQLRGGGALLQHGSILLAGRPGRGARGHAGAVARPTWQARSPTHWTRTLDPGRVAEAVGRRSPPDRRLAPVTGCLRTDAPPVSWTAARPARRTFRSAEWTWAAMSPAIPSPTCGRFRRARLRARCAAQSPPAALAGASPGDSAARRAADHGSASSSSPGSRPRCRSRR